MGLVIHMDRARLLMGHLVLHAQYHPAALQCRLAPGIVGCGLDPEGRHGRAVRVGDLSGLQANRRCAGGPRQYRRAAQYPDRPGHRPQQRYQLAEARYRKGVSSYREALDSQRSLYSAQQNLISLRLQEAVNRVTLYKVLGGGADATQLVAVAAGDAPG